MHTFDDNVVIPTLRQQLTLDLGEVGRPDRDQAGVYFSAPALDLSRYDSVIVCMSGGKDSIASLLHLIDLGVDMRTVELWHHDVDGREGSRLMDWAFMADYNRKLAAAFDLPIYFSWLDGGFEGELLKHNSYSRPHKIETPSGLITLARDTKRARPGTRRRFPQLSANLATRWCSSALKIDVGRRALTNQSRFDEKRILFVTGERREESSNRAKYNQLEPHVCDCRNGRKARHVDAWRPVLDWSEEQVWDALQRHRVTPPVPYRLGWNRSSCMTCIYNGPRIWATIDQYFPDRLRKIAQYEDEFGVTISRNHTTVRTIAEQSTPFRITDIEALDQAMRTSYTLPVLLTAKQRWTMPIGAFGNEGCGAA